MTGADLIRNQRAEVAALERSVTIYTEILADYERRLAEARRILERMERLYDRGESPR